MGIRNKAFTLADVERHVRRLAPEILVEWFDDAVGFSVGPRDRILVKSTLHRCLIEAQVWDERGESVDLGEAAGPFQEPHSAGAKAVAGLIVQHAMHNAGIAAEHRPTPAPQDRHEEVVQQVKEALRRLLEVEELPVNADGSLSLMAFAGKEVHSILYDHGPLTRISIYGLVAPWIVPSVDLHNGVNQLNANNSFARVIYDTDERSVYVKSSLRADSMDAFDLYFAIRSVHSLLQAIEDDYLDGWLDPVLPSPG